MTRQRDLSGFGVEAPPRPVSRPATVPRPEVLSVPPPPRPEGNANSASSSPPTKPKAAAKQRVTLSLPTQVAMLLRSTADTEQRIYLDIIQSAFVAHADEVENELIKSRDRLSTTGGRRRAGSGRTQIPLNILKEDLKVLDERVKALNLDRSTYVAELLVRELKR